MSVGAGSHPFVFDPLHTKTGELAINASTSVLRLTGGKIARAARYHHHADSAAGGKATTAVAAYTDDTSNRWAVSASGRPHRPPITDLPNIGTVTHAGDMWGIATCRVPRTATRMPGLRLSQRQLVSDLRRGELPRHDRCQRQQPHLRNQGGRCNCRISPTTIKGTGRFIGEGAGHQIGAFHINGGRGYKAGSIFAGEKR